MPESSSLAEEAPSSSRWLRLTLQSPTLYFLGCQMIVEASDATRATSSSFTKRENAHGAVSAYISHNEDSVVEFSTAVFRSLTGYLLVLQFASGVVVTNQHVPRLVTIRHSPRRYFQRRVHGSTATLRRHRLCQVFKAQPQRRSCTVIYLQRGQQIDHRGL